MHRGWRDNPVFRGEFSRGDAWVWLIENACWKPTKFDVKGKTITLERGQLCASRDYLAKVWGWSSSAVERFLTRLQTEQMIGRETGQGKSIVTISNYAKYQDVGSQTGQETGQQSGQRSDRDRTAKEQGNKGTREEEPNGSPSQGAGAPEGGEAGSDDLFGEKPAAKPKGKRSPAAEHTLPDDWEPNLTDRDRTIVDGWPPGAFDREEYRFRNHAIANGRKAKNWDAAFRTWIGKADEQYGHRIGNSGRGTFAGDRQPRPRTDGFTDAINDALARGGSSFASGPSGRWDDDHAAGDQGLRPARARVIR